ncbi:MAG: aspartate 1-decarboxylase [Spirochaetales bacterium]|nr:aspartate 1-decarboxylase [Spirochaetales bacterium]
MTIEVLKSKLHRGTVTDANLDYEGSISIDSELYKKAGFFHHEKVDVLNISNGNRLTTYIIDGGPGEICANGAAAHLCKPGDLVIIVSYAQLTPEEAGKFKAKIILLDRNNKPKLMTDD